MVSHIEIGLALFLKTKVQGKLKYQDMHLLQQFFLHHHEIQSSYGCLCERGQLLLLPSELEAISEQITQSGIENGT